MAGRDDCSAHELFITSRHEVRFVLKSAGELNLTVQSSSIVK